MPRNSLLTRACGIVAFTAPFYFSRVGRDIDKRIDHYGNDPDCESENLEANICGRWKFRKYFACFRKPKTPLLLTPECYGNDPDCESENLEANICGRWKFWKNFPCFRKPKTPLLLTPECYKIAVDLSHWVMRKVRPQTPQELPPECYGIAKNLSEMVVEHDFDNRIKERISNALSSLSGIGQGQFLKQILDSIPDTSIAGDSISPTLKKVGQLKEIWPTEFSDHLLIASLICEKQDAKISRYDILLKYGGNRRFKNIVLANDEDKANMEVCIGLKGKMESPKFWSQPKDNDFIKDLVSADWLNRAKLALDKTEFKISASTRNSVEDAINTAVRNFEENSDQTDELPLTIQPGRPYFGGSIKRALQREAELEALQSGRTISALSLTDLVANPGENRFLEYSFTDDKIKDPWISDDAAEEISRFIILMAEYRVKKCYRQLLLQNTAMLLKGMDVIARGSFMRKLYIHLKEAASRSCSASIQHLKPSMLWGLVKGCKIWPEEYERDWGVMNLVLTHDPKTLITNSLRSPNSDYFVGLLRGCMSYGFYIAGRQVNCLE